MHIIGSANPDSPFANNLSFPLVATLSVGGAALLAFLVIRGARVRRHPQAAAIIAIVLLWAVATAATGVRYVIQQTHWASEASLRLSSGYIDPNTPQPDAPAAPLAAWFFLALAYAGLALWTFSHRRRPPFE